MSVAKQTVLQATYGSPESPLRIADMEIPCYVLEDDRRVLSQGGMITSLGLSRGGANRRRGGDRLAKFVSGKRLGPFVSRHLVDGIVAPIKFRTPGGSIAYGYEATVLADICDTMLAARKAGILQSQQIHIADRCETLMRAFGRVGIIALVDEATGYQEVRDRNALHRMLEAYISSELLPWTKRFPNEFYENLFRLRGWLFRPLSVKRPLLVGKLTNQIVYEKLPPGVLDELGRLNPPASKGRRKYKHHQFLTEEIGNPHLERHLVAVVALMRAASTWSGFKRLLSRSFPGPGPHQLEFFDQDDGAEDRAK